jgi:hypothetical protein
MFKVDLNNGTVNGLNPVSSIEDIKSKLPCFSSTSTEGSTDKCGGGVFFPDKSINFYTGLDCISMQAKFKGSFSYNKVDVQLIGLRLSQVAPIFGRQPDFFRASAKPGMRSGVYTMSYGAVVLNLLHDHVVEVNICNQKSSSLKLCE